MMGHQFGSASKRSQIPSNAELTLFGISSVQTSLSKPASLFPRNNSKNGFLLIHVAGVILGRNNLYLTLEPQQHHPPASHAPNIDRLMKLATTSHSLPETRNKRALAHIPASFCQIHTPPHYWPPHSSGPVPNSQ